MARLRVAVVTSLLICSCAFAQQATSPALSHFSQNQGEVGHPRDITYTIARARSHAGPERIALAGADAAVVSRGGRSGKRQAAAREEQTQGPHSTPSRIAISRSGQAFDYGNRFRFPPLRMTRQGKQQAERSADLRGKSPPYRKSGDKGGAPATFCYPTLSQSTRKGWGNR